MPNPPLVGLLIADPALRQEIRTLVEALNARVAFDGTQFDWEPPGQLALDLLVVDERPGGVALAEFVQRIKSASPGTLLAVVQTSLQHEALMSALEARADEFIIPPVEAGIRAALERAAARHAEAGQKQARIAGFVSAKGGSGATTVACHCAAALARLSLQRVLLVDCDLDLPMVGFLTKSGSSNCLLDAARNLPRLDESYWNSLVSRRAELDVLPFPRGRSGNVATAGQVRQVFEFLRSLYGWVVVDLGRGLGPLFQPVLADFDDLFVVTTVTVPAIFEARDLLQRLIASGAPPVRLRLVLNRVRGPVPVGAEVMRPLLGAPVAAEISEDKAVDEAYAEGELAAGTTALGRAVEAFAGRLAGLPPRRRPSRWPWLDTWRKAVAG